MSCLVVNDNDDDDDDVTNSLFPYILYSLLFLPFIIIAPLGTTQTLLTKETVRRNERLSSRSSTRQALMQSLLDTSTHSE